MKGLLIKDLKLMKNQKMFFIVIAVMAVIFGYMMDTSSFIVGYGTFINSLFVISTISYDEFNNGFTFLFTLPVSRNDYVKEKYLFAFCLSGMACLAATLLSISFEILKGNELLLLESLLSSMVIFMAALVLVMIIIPVQLKFGQNKGNIAVVLVVGVVFVIGYLIIKSFEFLNIDIANIINWFSQLGVTGAVLILMAVVAVIGGISYQISSRIMLKKEF